MLFFPTFLLYFVFMPKKNSTKARTPAERYRDQVLQGYPEWPTWSRKLRRIFVSLPSYGVGEEALETMCEDFDWDYKKTLALVENNKTFKQAVNEFVENGYDYRTTYVPSRNGSTMLTYQVRWSALQRVYMMESGITSFIKSETGKISSSESKLIDKTGLLEIEPMANLPVENNNKAKTPVTADISGESSLYELEEMLNR